MDVLAITETWLTGKSWNSTVAEILNTLKGYEFYDVSRVSRTGGGEGVFLHREVSGRFLSSGDFNFHMDVDTDTDANNFKDLLESAGLAQHVKGPTHRSGHTLDFIIDRQNDTVLSSFTTLMDHHPIVCSMAFAKPLPLSHNLYSVTLKTPSTWTLSRLTF